MLLPRRLQPNISPKNTYIYIYIYIFQLLPHKKRVRFFQSKKDNNIKIYFFANATIKRKHKKEKKRQNIFILPKLQNMFPNLSLHRKRKDQIEFKNKYFLKNEKI